MLLVAGIGKLMNEQNSKLITMTTKSYEEQQCENQKIGKLAAGNEEAVDKYCEEAKVRLIKN